MLSSFIKGVFSIERDERSTQKLIEERFRKVLNRNDPFDQLILNFASTGILDVAIVDIGVKTKGLSAHPYSKKSLHRRGKHSL
jgi:hypothetical protein